MALQVVRRLARPQVHLKLASRRLQPALCLRLSKSTAAVRDVDVDEPLPRMADYWTGLPPADAPGFEVRQNRALPRTLPHPRRTSAA